MPPVDSTKGGAMLGKIKRFLMYLDDVAEVVVLHILFSPRNWKKTTCVLLVAAGVLYSGAIGSLSTAPETYGQKGYEALIKGRNAEAAALFEKAVQRDPARAIHHQRLGLAYLEMGVNERAMTALQASYRLSPSRTTLFYLGCVYQNMKLHDAAIGLFNQVKSANLKEATLAESAVGYEPVADAKIGECHVRRGQYERAIDILTRTIALYPSYPHSYFYLGVAYWEQGNPDLGVEQFFKVIELYPQESAAYYNVACYYAIKGIPDLALVWLEKAFKAGFAQFKHMETDPDMGGIRDLPQYRALVGHYRKVYSAAN
jgi:tetratricopeptide (TPR) repeat protein